MMERFLVAFLPSLVQIGELSHLDADLLVESEALELILEHVLLLWREQLAFRIDFRRILILFLSLLGWLSDRNLLWRGRLLGFDVIILNR